MLRKDQNLGSGSLGVCRLMLSEAAADLPCDPSRAPSFSSLCHPCLPACFLMVTLLTACFQVQIIKMVFYFNCFYLPTVSCHRTVVQVRHPLPTLQIAATSSRPSLILSRAPFQARMRRCLLRDTVCFLRQSSTHFPRVSRPSISCTGVSSVAWAICALSRDMPNVAYGHCLGIVSLPSSVECARLTCLQ